jgi:hypothetical protein
MTDVSNLPAAVKLTSEQRIAVMAFAFSNLVIGLRSALHEALWDDAICEAEVVQALDVSRVGFNEYGDIGPTAVAFKGKDLMSDVALTIDEDWSGPICDVIQNSAGDLVDAYASALKEEASK